MPTPQDRHDEERETPFTPVDDLENSRRHRTPLSELFNPVRRQLFSR